MPEAARVAPEYWLVQGHASAACFLVVTLPLPWNRMMSDKGKKPPAQPERTTESVKNNATDTFREANNNNTVRNTLPPPPPPQKAKPPSNGGNENQ